MCGRYSITTAPEAMRRLFGYPEQPNFPPRYNIAPTQPVPIVRLNQGKRQFALVRWGLLPAWVKDPGRFALLHVARGESVNEKPAFRNAMKRRRCLVPADGFYEWTERGERKRPFFVRAKSAGPIAFAGLWETWEGPNGEEVESVAIITTPANRLLGAIAERMPAILPPGASTCGSTAPRSMRRPRRRSSCRHRSPCSKPIRSPPRSTAPPMTGPS
jgi:putative SOS response-associated peptidase YedK